MAITTSKGKCKHGEFDLLSGCSQCVSERLAEQLREKLKTNIVKVKYVSDSGELSGREYTYYSVDRLSIGDIVIVPVRDTVGKAMVSWIDVPASEIEAFKDKVKTIPLDSKVKEEAVGVPNRSVPNETEAVIRVHSGACLAPTGYAPPSVGSTTAPPILATPIEIPTTALVKVNPETDTQVLMFLAESNRLRDFAEARVITTVEDLQPANDDYIIIGKLKKAMEDKRKEYVKPLQDHVKSINDAFKTLMEPIEVADRITGEKILAFQLKQKLIREEQEKINALRLEAAQKDAALHNGEISEPVNLVEVIPEVSRRVSTDIGTTGQKDRWTFEVIDFALLPDEYKMPDATKIGKVVRAGLHTIPGIKIWNEPILARTK